jgi:hypothetical protein
LLQIYALNYFTGLAKGEIASLSGAGMTPKKGRRQNEE